jgi:hypothetical protein
MVASVLREREGKSKNSGEGGKGRRLEGIEFYHGISYANLVLRNDAF